MTRALAGRTGWALLGELVRVAVTAVTLLVVARWLGAEEYGAFAGTLALVSVVAPFTAFGLGHVMIMEVAHAPACFVARWRDLLGATSLFAVAGVLALTVLGRLVLPDEPVALVLALAVGELVGLAVTEACAQAFQAHERQRDATVTRCLFFGARLLAVAVFATDATPTAVDWAVHLAVSSVLASMLNLVRVRRLLGGPLAPRAPRFSALRAGLPFAATHAFATVQDDLDKTLVLRQSSGEAGTYAAAYRFVALALTPVRAVAQATYPRFFALGRQGREGVDALVASVQWPVAAYGLMSVAVLVAAAPVVAALLGVSFAGAEGFVVLLAGLPLIRGLQVVAGNALSGLGRQHQRMRIQLLGCAVNVAANLCLIPFWGALGAVVASYASDLLVCLLLWQSYRRKSAVSESTCSWRSTEHSDPRLPRPQHHNAK